MATTPSILLSSLPFMRSGSTSWKAQRPEELRRKEAVTVRHKYPDRVPVICERAVTSSSRVPEIKKKKYLVPQDVTVGQFTCIIRRQLQMDHAAAIFLFVNGALPPVGARMDEIYREHKDPDGFLYLAYSGESTFGVGY
jgi:GABA(A) receptor-associated protein